MGLLDKFKKRHNTSPEKLESTTELAKMFLEKKYDEALVLHEKLFDENSEADWYTRGNILSNLNRRKEALDCYLKAIELKDTYIKAWFRLGQRYFEFENFKEARNAFVKVSSLEQKIGENEWNTLATFYYMMSLYMEYLNTKNEEIRKKIPIEIRKLSEIIDTDKNLTEDGFLDYCVKNFQTILDKLEPKVVAEFRHPESIN